MLATVAYTNNCSSPKFERVEEAAETWDAHTSSIREAIVEALTARKIAMRDRARVEALAETWERQLQAALQNSCSNSASEALLKRNICRDKARHLTGLIEQYCVQVNTLQRQLAFWQNQLG